MHIEANGTTFFVETAGKPDAPPVLLIHSLSADHEAWRPQIPALTEHFRVIAPDIRGHGKSRATPPPYTMETLADDMAAILDALDVQAAHVVGLSIGGMIAQTMALNHAGRVKSLLLAATASEMNEERRKVWDDRIASVEGDGVEQLVEPTLQRWFTPPTHDGDPETVRLCAAMIRRTPPEAYAGCAAAIRDLNLTARLGEISVPTLILSADQDTSTPPELQAMIRDAVPRARLETFTGTAHQIGLERPERFNELMMGFLKLVEAR
ncbi:3-oxoadipate enol-lactonase [Caenispirillum salinarum]|uniref:3-oxoadipate enol-lactonase n=1 Tax=Caenispirillum salinarum TaxID=859058 RepID=UPI00384FB6F8